MLIDVLRDQNWELKRLFPEIVRVLDVIGRPQDLSVFQAAVLTGAVNRYRPSVILDLGTGYGNSAAVFSVAGREFNSMVHTFDLDPHWDETRDRLHSFAPSIVRQIVAHVGDVTISNIENLLVSPGAVLIFWDMHGFGPAEWILGHVLPLIAQRPHIVICHDMPDKRYRNPAYDGFGIWQGMKDFYESGIRRPHVAVGWTYTIVDQVIPIFDFCWRNDLTFHSVEHEWYSLTEAERAELLKGVSLADDYLAMGYFSLNETERRFFPNWAPKS